MSWQPIDTAPKDGTNFVARIAKAVWASGREDGPFIASVRWDGSRWVFAEMFMDDATLTVSGWIQPGSQI